MINKTLTLCMCEGNAISTNYIKPFLQNHRKNFKWYNWNTYTHRTDVYYIIWFCWRMPVWPSFASYITITFIYLPTYIVNKPQNPKSQSSQVKCCSYQWRHSLQRFSLWGTSLFVILSTVIYPSEGWFMTRQQIPGVSYVMLHRAWHEPLNWL